MKQKHAYVEDGMGVATRVASGVCDADRLFVEAGCVIGSLNSVWMAAKIVAQ